MTKEDSAEALRTVSVIIPVRNAAHSIRSTLQSLGRERDVIQEVLLIDDGSCDATVRVAETAAKELDLPLIAIHVDFRSPGAARNVGLGEGYRPPRPFILMDERPTVHQNTPRSYARPFATQLRNYA